MKKKQEKNQLTSKERKLDRKFIKWIIALFCIRLAYNIFFEPLTIGHNINYAIYIFWIPVIIGVAVLAYYRRQFLRRSIGQEKGILNKIFFTGFYLIQGIIFSYLSFGLLASVSWDYANYSTAKSNVVETTECDVDRFWTIRGTYSVDFYFHNRFEKFNVQFSYFKKYDTDSPKKYKVKIEMQEGIWNYYVVKHWKVEEK